MDGVLTEEKMREIINESVARFIEISKKKILVEMSSPRNLYKFKIDNEFPQVLINWCLSRWCSLSSNLKLKQHWNGELIGHISNMAKCGLKGNDSEEKRMKAILEVWNENDYSRPEIMSLAIFSKFVSEGINIKNENFSNAVIDCIHNKEAIINVILSRDKELIRSYVESI